MRTTSDQPFDTPEAREREKRFLDRCLLLFFGSLLAVFILALTVDPAFLDDGGDTTPPQTVFIVALALLFGIGVAAQLVFAIKILIVMWRTRRFGFFTVTVILFLLSWLPVLIFYGALYRPYLRGAKTLAEFSPHLARHGT